MKKILLASVLSFLILPGFVSAAVEETSESNVNVTVTGGALDLSGGTTSILFDGYVLDNLGKKVNSLATSSFGITDYRGGWDGWGVNILMSDLVSGSDTLSEVGTTLDLNCDLWSGSITHKVCNTATNLVIGGTGTSSTMLLNAPQNGTSAGSFDYTLPVGFFSLNLPKTVKAGTYTGTMTYELIDAYTP